MSVDENDEEILFVGLAQISPVWFDREKTLDKIVEFVKEASERRCSLVVFGEAIVPGYPFWLELTNGSKFNDQVQKEIFAEYLKQSVSIKDGDLDRVCSAARSLRINIYLGCVERNDDRSAHSLFCSMVFISEAGRIESVHRKLMPTYEERLCWAIGDGNGLRVHRLGRFNVGGLNCWENWIPTARTALYGQGENLHVSIFPGSRRLTSDITRFIAIESRSFAVTVSGLMRREDFPLNLIHREKIIENAPQTLADGGSCVANPDGTWLIEPQVSDDDRLIVARLDHRLVRQERQNFDPTGHYSRPDVLKLIVNRQRQSVLEFQD